MRKLLLLALLLAAPCQAAAFSFSGYGDLRFALPDSTDRSALDGGLGKFRYGKGSSAVQFAGAVGQGTLLITPELMATAVARVDPNASPAVDLLEAFVRYRPVSVTRWRWAVKAGAFFAPFSLENTEIGWAPYWTLTPSAINAWYGDELRTIGGEGTLEWRGEEGTLKFIASAFGLNQPAGVMIASRGWMFDDTPTGLFQELRVPDATLILHHDTPPDSNPIFDQYDGHIGWYGGAVWSDASGWRAEVDRYDNEADPGATDGDYFGWRTKFWNLGLSDRFGDVVLLAQAVTGNTVIAPSSSFRANTDFDSAYLLLGWERGDWRLALRGEEFHTRTHNTRGASSGTSEFGTAGTASASWLPNDWMKLTGEVILIESTRGGRSIEGLSVTRTDAQFQLNARFYWD